jgi:hypothetical protein
MPWFAQCVDAGDGRLSLKRRWWSAVSREFCHVLTLPKNSTVISFLKSRHDSQ